MVGKEDNPFLSGFGNFSGSDPTHGFFEYVAAEVP